MARRTLLAVATALLFVGCRTTHEVPLDVKRPIASGETAKQLGDYRTAVVHFNSALDRYPDLASARLARGECFLALAGTAADSELRQEELHRATLDFAEAIRHGEGEHKLTAYLRAGESYEQLGQRERALEMYKALRDEDEAERWALIEANRRSGRLRQRPPWAAGRRPSGPVPLRCAS